MVNLGPLSSARTRSQNVDGGGGAVRAGPVRNGGVGGEEQGGVVAASEEAEAGAEGDEDGETGDGEGTEVGQDGLESGDPSLHLVLSENEEGENEQARQRQVECGGVSESAGGGVLVEEGGGGEERRRRAVASDFWTPPHLGLPTLPPAGRHAVQDDEAEEFVEEETANLRREVEEQDNDNVEGLDEVLEPPALEAVELAAGLQEGLDPGGPGEEHQVQGGEREEMRQPLLQRQQRIVAGVTGEREDITEYLEPEMPAAGPVTVDTDGWGRIDGLSAWECTLTGFHPMGEVPVVHQEKWVRAVATVLRRLMEADTEQELTRALKWWLILPQLLLRQSKRSGKKGQGAAWIAARFQAVVDGDWGKLITMLESDKVTTMAAAETRRRRRQRQGDVEQEDMERKREVVLDLVARGQVGRAAARIKSHGVASMASPGVREALRSKFPARERNLPDTVTRGQIVDNLNGLRESLVSLELGSSPGVGGMRPEFLVTLGKLMGEEDMARLEEHGLNFLNGVYPAWFYRAEAAITTVPLYKSSQRQETKLRPVGVAPSFLRTLERRAVRDNRPALQSYLEPQQLALSKAGGHRLVHMVRMVMEVNPTWVCCKVDVENAHSAMSRAAVVETLEEQPELRHMAWYFATSMAATTTLETGGQSWGEAGDGLVQGKPTSMAYFCVGLQPELSQVDRELREEGGGLARGAADDCYIMGPPDVAFLALNRFKERIRYRLSLKVQREKTEVYCQGELPLDTPADLPRAGVILDGVFYPGMEVYGVAVGHNQYVANWLENKVEEIREVVDKTCSLLDDDLQAKWTLLTSSVAQKMSYTLSLQYPSDILPAATKVDDILWSMMERATGLHIPREEEGRGVECVLDVPVRGLQGRSFQHWLARLPVRERGMGLRSMVDIIPTAFLGSLEMSLPFFCGEGGMCDLLEMVVGDVMVVEEAIRWRTLLNSNSRTAIEFTDCWNNLQGEAQDMTAYLGEELEGHLAVPLEGVGEGRVDGSTRHLVMEQREGLKARVLSKALMQHQDQTTRPVWAFPQFDKMSCAWLMATPSLETFIPSILYREAMATHLCLPSPCCQSHVGKPTGYRDRQGNATVVDVFGDTVMSATLCHDTWRTRHSDIMRAITARAREARVEVEPEVFGLFRDIIPAQAMGEGGELETVRGRSGCVPDLRLGFPVPLTPRPADYLPRRGRRPAAVEGQPAPAPRPTIRRTAPGNVERFIAELKVMGAGPTNYPRGEARSRDKAADRRARGLPALYRAKLTTIDRQYYGTVDGEVGPCQERLESLGDLLQVVVGYWGEVSTDLERIIRAVAEARVLHLARETGRPITDAWVGQVLGQHRRSLSAAFVRAQAACLVSRMGHLGVGAREAAARRKVAVEQELRLRREEEAYFAAHVRGRGRWTGR